MDEVASVGEGQEVKEGEVAQSRLHLLQMLKPILGWPPGVCLLPQLSVTDENGKKQQGLHLAGERKEELAILLVTVLNPGHVSESPREFVHLLMSVC